MRRIPAVLALALVAALLAAPTVAQAATPTDVMIWSGGRGGGDATGVRIQDNGQGAILARSSPTAAPTLVASFTASPAQMAPIRTAAEVAATTGERVVSRPDVEDGTYVSAVVRAGTASRILVGENATTPQMEALLAAVRRVLPPGVQVNSPAVRSRPAALRSGPQARAAAAIGGETITLRDGTSLTSPDAATCPPGQDATEIEKDIDIDAAARAGLVQMTSKGVFHGDSIAVDAKWKKFPAPVNITMNVELTQGPGASGVSANQFKTRLEAEFKGLKTSNNEPIRFHVNARIRAAGAPATPCFHQIELTSLSKIPRPYTFTADPNVKQGIWDDGRPHTWAHEALHVMGAPDRYNDVVQVGKDFFSVNGQVARFDPGAQTASDLATALGGNVSFLPYSLGKKGVGSYGDIMANDQNVNAKSRPQKVDLDQISANAPIQIVAHPGDVLVAKRNDTQNMGVAANFKLKIPKNSRRRVNGLIAYCLDLTKHAPNPGSAFDVLGPTSSLPENKRTRRALTAVLRAIAKRGLSETNDLSAQVAVWRVTDNFTFGLSGYTRSILRQAHVPLKGKYQDKHFTTRNHSRTTRGITPKGRRKPSGLRRYRDPASALASVGGLFEQLPGQGASMEVYLETVRADRVTLTVQQGTRVVARLGTFALPFGFSHLSPPVGTLPSGSYTLVAKGRRGPALSAAFRVG